jgi:uncharacterized membrane protein
METPIEALEQVLFTFITWVRFVLETLAALMVFSGLIRTLQYVIKMRLKKQKRGAILKYPLNFIQIRLTFGMWLALALEFQLGADILTTTMSPTLEALIQLAVIAVIRTFLNYFLNKELEMEYSALKPSTDETTSDPSTQ